MNPRRVHELMRKHFPAFDAASVEWTNVVERSDPDTKLLESLLNEHVPSEEVLVQVHRMEGAFLPRCQALAYIVAHIGQGQIRIADRQFTSFMVVALNGVVTGWKNPEHAPAHDI